MPLIQETLSAGQSVRFSPRGTSMLPSAEILAPGNRLAPAASEIKTPPQRKTLQRSKPDLTSDVRSGFFASNIIFPQINSVIAMWQ